jgi:hypothetical protein
LQLLEVACEGDGVFEADRDDGAEFERLAGELEVFPWCLFLWDECVDVEERNLGLGQQ